MSLGLWAVIDIETTGINPGTDEIIDLGFFQFDGLKLIRSYSSLVRPQHEISPYISKLTGITGKQLAKAPLWEKVENDLLELESHHLIAHNAGFEKSFLERYFEKIKNIQTRETYQDSIYYLALLHPELSTLNLENFLIYYDISEKEEHRGFADARDLLKVLLLATFHAHQKMQFKLKLSEVLISLGEEFWFSKFFHLNTDQLIQIAEQIDFELRSAYRKFSEKKENDSYQKIEEIKTFTPKFSGENIQAIFNDERSIQKVLPGYQRRLSQEMLALKVGQSFKNNIHSLIQAPTGTGKTIGYLVPGVLFSLSEKETCLISTGTKTLQDQAITKDVPRTLAMLGLKNKIKAVRLVGSGNHLCELLFRDDEHRSGIALNFEEAYSRAYLEIFFHHNSEQPYEKQLTRDSIPYVLKKMFKEIAEHQETYSVDYRSCIGPSCPFVKKCSYISGLREAKEAQIIIGNHALMLSWPKSFPRPKYIVVDEAHKLEAEATKAFSIELTQFHFEIFTKTFSQSMGALIYLWSQSETPGLEEKILKIREETNLALKIFRDHIDLLPQVIESLFKKLSHYSPLYSNEIMFPRKNELKDTLSSAAFNHFESLFFVATNLMNVYLPFYNSIKDEAFNQDVSKLKAKAVFENGFNHLEKMTLSLQHFFQEDQNWVTSLVFGENQGYKVESFPIDVGKKIHEELLEPSSSVVFTSATLANSKGDTGTQSVEWMTGYSYLKPEKRFKAPVFLEAVFDYKQKAKVFVASDQKPITDIQFVPEVLTSILPLIERLNGRTLILFSSKIRFEQAVDFMLRNCEQKIPVFVQGLGKNVIEEFKKAPYGVLIGMESFGEGIDIPGEKLQFIVIDKIPDVRQDLIIQKRREFFEFKFGNEFNDYFLAQRTRSLHQKFGRLLRTEDDFGAILLIDNRIKKWKGGTLKTFQKLMEPYDLNMAPLKEACEKISDYFQL